MAGTLTIGTLSDGTNSTSSTNPIRGSAKAWVYFDGNTGTITSSFNVSSVTRSAVGDYTINFTTAFTDANYSMSGSAGRPSFAYPCFVGPSETGTHSTTACQIYVVNSADGKTDSVRTSAVFFR